jgi:hypothetical protein
MEVLKNIVNMYHPEGVERNGYVECHTLRGNYIRGVMDALNYVSLEREEITLNDYFTTYSREAKRDLMRGVLEFNPRIKFQMRGSATLTMYLPECPISIGTIGYGDFFDSTVSTTQRYAVWAPTILNARYERNHDSTSHRRYPPRKHMASSARLDKILEKVRTHISPLRQADVIAYHFAHLAQHIAASDKTAEASRIKSIEDVQTLTGEVGFIDELVAMQATGIWRGVDSDLAAALQTYNEENTRLQDYLSHKGKYYLGGIQVHLDKMAGRYEASAFELERKGFTGSGNMTLHYYQLPAGDLDDLPEVFAEKIAALDLLNKRSATEDDLDPTDEWVTVGEEHWVPKIGCTAIKGRLYYLAP